ncbi:glutathione ABC transporter substrate-binding protein [Fonticella tunisiensis]|uniref:Peptide/nickel transport system substrate-binding protein n=1 Tax=Fonticella tunisiensis TaxID=1096341 RepID=A0A4R7KBJ4_9CLOT|nr:glutathione ABC transporter substrate-binding protein [Fonticella tunisiensis]TDT51063.1 peptide/nickel transport system substrate-binding protein [Fonticella tunisiensis]
MKKNFLSKTISIFLVAVITAALFAGCGSETSKNSSSAPQKITYVSMTDAVGLSPILTNDSASSAVIRTVYETLFMRDPKTGEIKPLLAEGYENPDPNTWIIKLKKNIKFQDGTPFNSEAVKYTFEKILDPKTASPRASLLKSVDKIETPDEYTVVLHTKTPYGIMLTALAHDNLSIVSPKADKAGDINKNAKGAGTGPYIFEEWVPGDHITVVKNKDYWGGAPKIDSITFKVVPEMATAVSMVETGEADMLVGIPPEHLERLKNNADVEVTQLQGNSVTYLGFNFEKKPFDNLKVRQAIEHAINRDEYISTLNGLGIRSNGIIGPKLIGYNSEIESHGYKYDVEKAKALLAEAGYPSGFKATLTYGNTDTYNKIAPFIQAQLKKINIDVTLNPMDWAAYLSYAKSGKAEMYLGGWSNVTGDGEELLYPQFFSGNIGASNYARYNNPEADALILKTRETIDQNQRVEYLRQANIKFTDDVLWVPLYHGVVTMAVRKNLKGIELESNGEFRFNKAYKE